MHDARMHDAHQHGPGPRGRGRRLRGDMMGGPGPGWGGGRRRMRRGDIRRAVLLALLDGPANGYEVMRRLEERSGGLWRPSPGPVYPTLQMLADEGMVGSTTGDGSRSFELTDEGRQAAQAGSAERGGRAPWETGDESDDRLRALREAVGQIHMAAKQVAHAGGADQIDRSIEIVQRARKELYQILAED